MQGLSFDEYKKLRANKQPEKIKLATEYELFQQEFDRWTKTVEEERKCESLEAVVCNKLPPIPPALHSVVEFSTALELDSNHPIPSVSSVLSHHTEAGFAKTLDSPLELSAAALDLSHAHLVYPHVHVYDIVIGVVTHLASAGWTINVRRICNPKLNDIWNLSIPAFCHMSSTFEESAAPVMRRRPRIGDYIKAGVLHVPLNPKEPLILSCRKTQLLQAWSDRFHVLGLSTEDSLYRDVVTDDYNSIEEEIRLDGSFENPSSLLAMSNWFGITDELSLNRGPKLDREEYADKLRSQQEAIWAEDVSRSGFRHFSRSDLDRASDLFSQALALNANCVNAQLGKAMVHGARSDFDRALFYIHHVLKAVIPPTIMRKYHAPPLREPNEYGTYTQVLSPTDLIALTVNKDATSAIAVLQRLNTRHMAARKRSIAVESFFRPLLSLPYSDSPFSPTKPSSTSTSSPSPISSNLPTSSTSNQRRHGSTSTREMEDEDEDYERRLGSQLSSSSSSWNFSDEETFPMDDRGSKHGGAAAAHKNGGNQHHVTAASGSYVSSGHTQNSAHYGRDTHYRAPPAPRSSLPHDTKSSAATTTRASAPSSSYGHSRDFYDRKDDRREDRFTDRGGRTRGANNNNESSSLHPSSSSSSFTTSSSNRRDDRRREDRDDRRGGDRSRDYRETDYRKDDRGDYQQRGDHHQRRDGDHQRRDDQRRDDHHHHQQQQQRRDDRREGDYQRRSDSRDDYRRNGDDHRRDSRDDHRRDDQRRDDHRRSGDSRDDYRRGDDHRRHQEHHRKDGRDHHQHPQHQPKHQPNPPKHAPSHAERTWSSIVAQQPTPSLVPSPGPSASTASSRRPYDQPPQPLSNLSVKRGGYHEPPSSSGGGSASSATANGGSSSSSSSGPSSALHSMIIDPDIHMSTLSTPSLAAPPSTQRMTRSASRNAVAEGGRNTPSNQQQPPQRQQYQRKRTREPSPKGLVPNKVPRNGHSASPYSEQDSVD